MKSHKPDGYTTVSPYLIVDGASATIEFLRNAFGAVELRRFPDQSGKVIHAEVRIDDTVVMIADGANGCAAHFDNVRAQGRAMTTTEAIAFALRRPC